PPLIGVFERIAVGVGMRLEIFRGPAGEDDASALELGLRRIVRREHPVTVRAPPFVVTAAPAFAEPRDVDPADMHSRDCETFRRGDNRVHGFMRAGEFAWPRECL